MKPLKLTISAFASFAGIEMIDFTVLGDNGLYLITGETGAGKTTIFDAISFALFGKASGQARDNYNILRSDYAGEKQKTFVELDFSSGKYKYNIKRTIKKTGQEVSLTLSEGTVISGDRNATNKIIEIVGLDRDQFSQIVMIAQNDFLRFLQSGTAERVKILRRIFNTGAFRSLQVMLKNKEQNLREKLNLCKHTFDLYGVDPYQREEQFSLWELQIEDHYQELQAVDNALKENNQQFLDLAAQIAVSQDLYTRFRELSINQTAIDEHNTKAEEIRLLEKHIINSEKALHKVKPLADRSCQADIQYQSIKADFLQAKDDVQKTNDEYEQAKKIISELPPLEETKNAFNKLCINWNGILAKLNKLTLLQAGFDDITDKKSILKNKYAELTIVKKTIEELPSLEDMKMAFEMIGANWQLANDKLTHLQELEQSYRLVEKKQDTQKIEQSIFETLNNEFLVVDSNYKSLEEVFLREQAGILANSLAENKPCPVCGSMEHPDPAQITNDSINEATVKQAQEKAEVARHARDQQASLCLMLKTELDTLSKHLTEALAKLLPITAAVAIDTILTELLQNVAQELKTLTLQKEAAAGALTTLRHSFEQETAKQQQLESKCVSLNSEIETLNKRFINDLAEYLPDLTWAQAKQPLAIILHETKQIFDELTIRKEVGESNLDKLSETWDSATQKYNNAQTALKSALVLLKDRQKREAEYKKTAEQVTQQYLNALQQNSFENENEYLAVLMTEEKLLENQQLVKDHQIQGEILLRDNNRLKKETKGKVKPDLEQLEVISSNQKEEINELTKKRDEIKTQLEQTQRMLKALRPSADDFAKCEKKFAAIKQLSEIANGKLDFETYAQMAYFERVLNAANLRLKAMSRNQYHLLRRKDSTDRRKASGLEIEVFDNYTGKARSANSLSGGESFMASLSLAIGLSDVVQQNAGGIHLDAMFIDEGFGSLDTDVLELSIQTLSGMAGDNRMIGIISHVSELRERIDKQVRVQKTASGSKVDVLG